MKNRKHILALLAFAATVSCSNDSVSGEFTLNDNTPHDSTHVRIAIVADIHVMTDDILQQKGKAFDKYLFDDGNMLETSQQLFDKTLDYVASNGADLLIVIGDLAKNGELSCHEYVSARLKTFTETTGIPVNVVRGNNDCDNPLSQIYNGDKWRFTPSLKKEDFPTMYSSFGFGDAVMTDPNTMSYMSYPVPGIAVIGIDSNKPSVYGADGDENWYNYDQTYEDIHPSSCCEVGGYISTATLGWVKQAVSKAKSDGRAVITVSHHPVMNHYEYMALVAPTSMCNSEDGKSMVQKVLGAISSPSNSEVDKLCDGLIDAGVQFVISGHHHVHSIKYYRKSNKTLYNIMNGALTFPRAPMRWADVDLASGTVTFTNHFIDPDYDCYAPETYAECSYNRSTFYPGNCVNDALGTVIDYLNENYFKKKVTLSKAEKNRLPKDKEEVTAILQEYLLPSLCDLYGKLYTGNEPENGGAEVRNRVKESFQAFVLQGICDGDSHIYREVNGLSLDLVQSVCMKLIDSILGNYSDSSIGPVDDWDLTLKIR